MGGTHDQLIGAEFGRYRIAEFIGEGGMALVYRAVLEGPLGFSRSVAIKQIRTDREHGAERRLRSLINEARLGGKLSHPNVVDVLEFGESDSGFYIVMEYVDGPTLAHLLRQCRERGVILPRKNAMQIIAEVSRGLAYAHELEDETGQQVGLIHRDLKPGNILIGGAGQAMVADFGLAKSDANLFQSTTVEAKGTPAYMSPEQVTCKELTPASDLFSLGSILYELLRGEPLFVGEHLLQIAQKITVSPMEEELAWMREQVPYAALLFEQLTAKDPADRPSSAREVEHQLNEIVRGFPSEGSLSDYVDWLEHAAPGDVPPSGSGEYTTPTPGSWSDGGTPAAAVSPESNPPGHSGDVKIAAGGRRNRIWLLALLLLILGALGFGWAMGWYQGRDGVERAHRRALRAEARGQAQVERQARKDAVRSDPDPDPAGPEFGAVEPDDESVTPVGLAVVDPVPPKNEGPAAGGGGAPVTVVAEEALAPLMIQCMPWCDQIQVDGEVWGGSPVLDRSTTVGHHEIRLHAATGAEANVSLEVTADGAKLCWDFELGGACTSP